MNFFNNILAWVKANILLAVVILIVGIALLFPKVLRGVIGPRRIRHRRTIAAPYRRRRRSLPRSVGMYKIGRTRKQYTKGGKAKKAWQIKGSIAARRHMAQIRRMR
jgi:hypothetical protein